MEGDCRWVMILEKIVGNRVGGAVDLVVSLVEAVRSVGKRT